jgi:elongation factor P--(R)-beta-lysine ligase
MKTWEKIKDNPSLLEKYLIREKVINSVRSFFCNRLFHEVQTPILVPTPSCEANLEVFQTELKTFTGLRRRAFLIMSPEYSIKKLLSAGIGNCFEITRCFRNDEEISSSHNPEFTMLEWYRINASYLNIMEDFEKLFIKVVKDLDPKINLIKWIYQNRTYDISPPWTRITVSDAFNKYAGIDTETLLSDKKLIKIAKKRGYKVDKKTTWEEIFYQLLFNEIEPSLKKTNKPYFLYDYPLSQASLSKKKASDPRFAERFEVFLAGVELGNCFSELTDANEQKARFIKDLKERKKGGKIELPIDNELIKALSKGMPEVSGIAVGVDRLIMLTGNFSNISETLFFPAREIFDLPYT